jgi:tetratricopeptide (TPR) repeat protein
MAQAYGAYYRRQKEYARALEHTHHALNIYQSLGDDEGVLKTYINLGATYQRAEGYTQAAAYYRQVIDLTRRLAHDADHLAVAHLNLGACDFSLSDYAGAVASYARALDICQSQQLAQRGGQACYNLAEAHYAWFKASQEPLHQTLGDEFVERAIGFWRGGNYLADIENARKLKADQHGRLAAPDLQTLAPREKAEHVAAMAEIDELRLRLDKTDPAHAAADVVHLRMEIARRYARIAAREREVAMRFAAEHGQTALYETALKELTADFAHSISQEQTLAARAAKAANLPEATLAVAFRHLLRQGSLTKSSYAEVCQVSAATASKHLVALAESGMLVQLGKGPSTRYVLPE